MSKFRSFTLAFGAAVLAVTSLAACSDAADEGTTTITMAFPLPEKGFLDPANWWMNEVEKRSDGRIDIQPHYNGSLVPASETLAALREGRIGGGAIANGYYPNEMPLYQVAGLPFETFDGPAQAQALQKLYAEDEDFRKEIEGTGIHIGFFIAYTPTIIATKTPANSAADLKGKRFRAAGPFAQVLKQNMGADAVFLDPTEIFPSLERGVIDGVAGFPFDTAVDMGLTETVPNITDIGYGHYASTSIALSKDVYDGLSADLRKIVDEVSAEVVADRNVKFVADLESSRCAALLKAGGNVNVWADEPQKKLKQSIGSTYVEGWVTNVVKAGHSEQKARAFYDAYHAAYDEATATSGYESYLSNCGN